MKDKWGKEEGMITGFSERKSTGNNIKTNATKCIVLFHYIQIPDESRRKHNTKVTKTACILHFYHTDNKENYN